MVRPSSARIVMSYAGGSICSAWDAATISAAVLALRSLAPTSAATTAAATRRPSIAAIEATRKANDASVKRRTLASRRVTGRNRRSAARVSNKRSVKSASGSIGPSSTWNESKGRVSDTGRLPVAPPEGVAGPRHQRFDARLRLAELATDLAHGQAIRVMEHEHCSLQGREGP